MSGTKVVFGEARKRFLSGEPIQMSERTRELARLVIEQRDRDLANPEPAEVWAKRLVDSMYGK
jgi:hypothetical protein